MQTQANTLSVQYSTPRQRFGNLAAAAGLILATIFGTLCYQDGIGGGVLFFSLLAICSVGIIAI